MSRKLSEIERSKIVVSVLERIMDELLMRVMAVDKRIATRYREIQQNPDATVADMWKEIESLDFNNHKGITKWLEDSFLQYLEEEIKNSGFHLREEENLLPEAESKRLAKGEHARLALAVTKNILTRNADGSENYYTISQIRKNVERIQGTYQADSQAAHEDTAHFIRSSPIIVDNVKFKFEYDASLKIFYLIDLSIPNKINRNGFFLPLGKDVNLSDAASVRNCVEGLFQFLEHRLRTVLPTFPFEEQARILGGGDAGNAIGDLGNLKTKPTPDMAKEYLNKNSLWVQTTAEDYIATPQKTPFDVVADVVKTLYTKEKTEDSSFEKDLPRSRFKVGGIDFFLNMLLL